MIIRLPMRQRPLERAARQARERGGYTIRLGTLAEDL
jgi:hypothetical protein